MPPELRLLQLLLQVLLLLLLQTLRLWSLARVLPLPVLLSATGRFGAARKPCLSCRWVGVGKERGGGTVPKGRLDLRVCQELLQDLPGDCRGAALNNLQRRWPSMLGSLPVVHLCSKLG
jgi:hypothetical protein